MTEPASLFDPLGVGRGLASRLEKGLTQLANQGVKSEQFAKAMHKALGASLATRQLTKQFQNRLLEALNLPTRSDIQALTERLQAVEDRIAAMTAAVDRLGSGWQPGSAVLPLPAPPRTRKPPPQAAAVVATAVAVGRRKRGKARP